MGNKPELVTSQEVKLDSEYVQWIHEIKQRYRNSQIKAAVKVNSEQLLFNWQLGRDLVVRKAEEKWGTGIVNQVSLDLQAEFPEAKGFSARNLWFMRQWYSFYALNNKAVELISDMEEQVDIGSVKLKQVASEIHEAKVKQVASELEFPSVFAFVPWMHHVLIIQKSKSIEEALFYIRKTVEGSLSRNALTPTYQERYRHRRNMGYSPEKARRMAKSGPCYVATSAYGSYNCPQVCVLRRFQDYRLMQTGYGRAFVKLYYAVSPSLVRLLGETKWFNKACRLILDRIVAFLEQKGYRSDPYCDR